MRARHAFRAVFVVAVVLLAMLGTSCNAILGLSNYYEVDAGSGGHGGMVGSTTTAGGTGTTSGRGGAASTSSVSSSQTSAGTSTGTTPSTSASSASSTSSSSTNSSTSSSSSSSSASTSGSSSASTGMGIGDCTSNAECNLPNSFCAIVGCVPGTMGMCSMKPPLNTNFAPVCGCNGVTYWNFTLAASDGVAIHVSSACDPQFAGMKGEGCSVQSGCNNGLKCNIQVSQLGCAVANAAVGTCWQLPLDCASTTMSAKDCNGDQCDLLCGLIDLNKPYYDGNGCVPP
jgi:hypothetical protein